MWLLSAWKGDLPFSNLIVNILIVSIEGYAKTHKTKTGFFVPFKSTGRLHEIIAKYDNNKPIKRLPESPINILAGNLL